MKYIAYTTLSLLAVILAGCSTPAPKPEAVAKSDTAVSYSVYGMDCPGCHGGLEKNLKKIPGVMDAAANWKRQTVTLILAESAAVTDEQIRQAVENSNFTLGEPTP